MALTYSAAGPAARGLVDLVSGGAGGEDGDDEDHEREGGHGGAQDDECQLRRLHPAQAAVQLEHVLQHAQRQVHAPAKMVRELMKCMLYDLYGTQRKFRYYPI